MNVKFSSFKYIPGLNNAYVKNKAVYIGSTMVVQQNKEPLLTVAAHEFGHLTCKNQLKMTMIATILILLLYPLLSLPFGVYFLGATSFVVICMIPVNCHFEFKADETAVDYV